MRLHICSVATFLICLTFSSPSQDICNIQEYIQPMVLVIRKSVNDVTQRPVLMPVYGEKGDLIGKSDIF